MNRLDLILMLGLLASAMQAPAQDRDLALVGGRVYTSPTANAIVDSVVLLRGDTIVAVGKRSEVTIPTSARVIDCGGKVITASFWNSHVHFQTGWEDAPNIPSAKLTGLMRDMLTKWGFTTVWDLGSDPQNTLAIRKRVESGEIPGARILMAGDIFPKSGHPVYLPPEMQLIEAATPEEAKQEALDYQRIGLDGIKLFTGSYMGNKPVVNMDATIVRAAVDVAHARHEPVFAHPQNRPGVDNALAGGVDVLAHTVPSEGSYTDAELARMKQQHVALIPTLTLWTIVFPNPQTQNKATIEAGVNELRQYASVGGTILFGTDVGFQATYDPTQEYQMMAGAMTWREILASLTTNPARFFNPSNQGHVEKEMRADLVVLDADPADDVRNFAKVAYTIRDGKVVYSEQ